MKEQDDNDFNNDINSNINNYDINNKPEEPSQSTIEKIYDENKKQNKLKIDTTEFLSYTLKVELLFQTLQSYLYWVSMIELSIFLFLFFMFCSAPKSLSKIWWYILHFFRSILGICLLYGLPKSYEIIESLKEYPDILDTLKTLLIQKFFDLLKPNQKKLKIILMCYFCLTIFCIIIDIMMFCVFAPDIGIQGSEKRFLFMLISSVVYIYVDFIYFSFFSSFKFYFNKKQHDDIQRATIVGFFDQLKIGMAQGVVSVAKKISRLTDLATSRSNSSKSHPNPFHKSLDKNEIRDVEVMN